MSITARCLDIAARTITTTVEITEDVANLQLIREHDCDQGGLNDCVSSMCVRQR
jgi:hypothetical protein